MTNFNALVSYATIASAVNFNTKKNFQMYNVRPEVINCVMREWKRLEELAMSEEHNLLQCPACNTKPHNINVDGNSKLYRYKKAGGVTEIDYKSELILDSTDVDREVDKLRGSKSGTAVQEVVDDSCGETKLKNAQVGGKAHSSKDETGLMLATCRHVFILKGLDMKRGEIFQYPYILQKQFPTAQFFAYDVACRYYPWLQKFDGETAKKQTPMLSVMHAKSHKWPCQMKWSGKVVKGAGRSTGETCEQANSYLSRLGPVTRNSHSAVRRERITQSAKFGNSRKLLELPVWIAAQLSKVTRCISFET
ncbi:uncharacterized protein [Watersipora subatra]|uniref:uncharacterized protein n=1 Tax=Watersipora subatra TaxID=2589382 RepID=UPI00355BB817